MLSQWTPLVATLIIASGGTLKEEKPGLRKKATVAYKVAEKTALAKVPASKVVEAEIEVEGGRLVYSFDLRVEGKPGIEEVQVDARTGEVVSVEHEGPAAEQAEKAHDAREPNRGK